MGEESLDRVPAEGNQNRASIKKQQSSSGEEKTWAIGSSKRSEVLYPSNSGPAGVFRVRSAESLPFFGLTFGIGGEFYSVNNAPNLGTGTKASTIAESLFVGFAPTDQLTLGISRRSSSTTYGNPSRLVASLGDLNFTGMYAFPLNETFSISPLVNFLIASDFNDLAPAGSTVSFGGGLAFTASLFQLTGLPFFAHANLIYHMPQIRDTGPAGVNTETYFQFSRFHNITFALGGEIKFGDFIPFLEFHQVHHANSQVNFGNTPSRLTLGSRFTPLDNKSLCFLLGFDVGLGKGLAAGVPYTPGYQIIGQLSYTVGLKTTERKHYETTKDINIVDRKFVIGKRIRFKVNSATLLNQSKTLLNEIARVIKSNNVKKLLIVGHTDSTATESYNLKLSKRRANSVKNYLATRGIPNDSMSTQGYGKRKPVASNLSAQGRAQNRRVEFFILE